MKHFLRYCAIFAIPIIIFLITLEIIVGNIPNSYSYKYNYVIKHGDGIQALAVGHSELYDGFMPESFYLPSFNLSNAAQDFIDNYYLLCELLPYMPNLKLVIMPVGYSNVRVINNKKKMILSDRSCYYHKYMNLDYDGHVPLRYLFESFDPHKASDKVYSYYIKHKDIVRCDSMGRRSTHYLQDRKHELGYNKIIEGYTQKECDYHKLCIDKEDFLLKTLEMLCEKNISIVMVSPPYYWDCAFKNINEQQRCFVKRYMDDLCSRYPILYFDHQSDSTFTYDDFYNETHLSEIGAKKFTEMLNRDIKQSIISSPQTVEPSRRIVERK